MNSMDTDTVKRLAKQGTKAQLESAFLASWRRLFPGLPKPTLQHRFSALRKWRFDFAFIEQKIAVEIQGGSWIRGGHNTALGQQKDYEKMRAAIKLGWRVVPFNSADMKDPDFCATEVAELLTNAKDVA